MKKNKIELSEERQHYLKKIRNKKILVITLQIIIFISIFAFWELFSHIGVLDPFYFSSPSRMINTLSGLLSNGTLFYHIGITLYEAILGFLIATVLGFLIAVLLWWSETLRRVLDPYIVVLNSLPKIALGPIIIIWFGTGTTAIVVMAILILIVITILSTLGAFLSCDKDKIQLMRSMKASKLQIFTKLVFPNAMPEFISILKINVGMTWVGTIMGEYLASSAGLGYLIVYGGQTFNLSLVMTSTILLCILAGGMYALVALLEKKISKHIRR